MISNTQLIKIKKIQNQCVATIDKRLSISDTYRNYQLLTFEDMIVHETNKLWHKHHLNLLLAALTKKHENG